MTQLQDDLASLRIPAAAPIARRKSRAWIWVAVVVVLVLAFAGWRTITAAVEVQTLRPTVEAGGGSGSPILTAAGYVVARRRAVVSAKIQGRLADLRVEEGARVREGEVFARLESTDFEASVARARAALARADAQVASAAAAIASADAQIARSDADLAEARRQMDIADRLLRDQVISTDQMDSARSRVRVGEAVGGQVRAEQGRARADARRAEAERDQARADVAYAVALLQNTYIRAPFTGTVVKKMAEVGESVAPIPPGVNISTASGAIVALADLDTLEAEVDVAEANVARLADGQPATVIVEAFPDRTYRASLRQIIPTADRTRATVTVKVTILDKDRNLKPEMSAKVTFLEPPRAAGDGSAPVVLLPQSAIVTRDGVPNVVLVVDGRASFRAVTLGGKRQERVVVSQGLSGGETVVARPPASLAAGTRVRARAS